MSLDLIYPGRDTATLVKDLSDDWLISGPIRAAIHLSNVWHVMEPKALTETKGIGGRGTFYALNTINVFGPNDHNHAWTRWAARSQANYSWLYFYASDMRDEYPKRFPHMVRHGASRMLEALENVPESLPEGEWDEPSFATNVEFA